MTGNSFFRSLNIGREGYKKVRCSGPTDFLAGGDVRFQVQRAQWICSVSDVATLTGSQAQTRHPAARAGDSHEQSARSRQQAHEDQARRRVTGRTLSMP